MTTTKTSEIVDRRASDARAATVQAAPRAFRRIVTARSNTGQSFLLDDQRVEEGSLGNFNFWRLSPHAPDAQQLSGGGSFPFAPAAGGNLFRVFRLPAPVDGASPEELRRQAGELAAAIGLPGCQPDTSRHPFMHLTPTTDYIMLLSGAVTLLLDAGEPIALQPFDVVVQRQTNHAWVNTGRADAFLLAVMMSHS